MMIAPHFFMKTAAKFLRHAFVRFLFLLPEFGHILQGLTLGLRHEFPYEDGGKDTDDTIQAVGEPIAHAVGKRNERGRYYPIEYPLEGNGDGNGCSTDGIREHFGDKHPADRSPREHKGC